MTEFKIEIDLRGFLSIENNIANILNMIKQVTENQTQTLLKNKSENLYIFYIATRSSGITVLVERLHFVIDEEEPVAEDGLNKVTKEGDQLEL